MKTGINKRMNLFARLCLAAVPLIGAGIAGAQPNDPSGIEFVTIGALNNPAYPGEFDGVGIGVTRGRGSVGYEYRIGKTEITTAQWLEFRNTFATQLPVSAIFARPTSWGAWDDPNYSGPGRRWVLTNEPGAALIPVIGISRRDAARYCNWLHNGKSTSLASIESGVYDTSTFTQNPDGTFNDQVQRSPGARYWIPSIDEWLKAAHYDPKKTGPGEGGWWRYSHTSDVAPIPGLPGEGQTTAGISYGNQRERRLPLMSYPDVMSPWGLFDTSGGASEYLEGFSFSGTLVLSDGNYAGSSIGFEAVDRANWYLELGRPNSGAGFGGLRIASVPSAGAWIVMLPIVLRSRRTR